MNNKWEWAFRVLGFVLVALVFYVWNLGGEPDSGGTEKTDGSPAASATASPAGNTQVYSP